MTIDIRATVTCSLGTLISASISDDYLQGTGLVKCKGSCEISGIVTPEVGTVVTFSYTQGGVTRQVPRKLRVLSSFADPFRRTTRVELGCKLTYLQDLKESINWTAQNDPTYASYDRFFFDYASFPLNASSIFNLCLLKLGILTSSNPLNNRFSVTKFDLSPGYVNIMSDLLVSESYFGYLDINEVLQVVPLAQVGGTGPVIDASSIIDVASIGVGQLPGEAVVVTYNSQKFVGNLTYTVGFDFDNPPQEETDASNVRPSYVPSTWSFNSTSTANQASIGYTDQAGEQRTWIYSNLQSTETSTNFKTTTNPDGEEFSYVDRRITEEYNGAASVCGSYISQLLSVGVFVGNYTVNTTTYEDFYYDAYGNETERVVEIYGDTEHAFGSMALPYVFSAEDYVAPKSRIILSKTVTTHEIGSNYKQSVTKRYLPWFKTIVGQQAVAESSQNMIDSQGVSDFIDYILDDKLHLVDVSTAVSVTPGTSQIIEDSKELFYEAAKKPGYDNDAVSSSSNDNLGSPQRVTRLELAFGSPFAQRRIEFSVPYSSDDYFLFSYSSGFYTTIQYQYVGSNAAAMANLYGRVQNSLLLGNRSGMNLQVAASRLPDAPFAPLIVQANGLSALYRTNGSSWTMDSNGIVASTDALFWGAVGGTGDFWFPVAPGITTLPTTPAVVGGQMTVSSTVPVWNETLLADARTRVGIEVQSFSYALELLSEVPSIRVRTGLSAARITPVRVPATQLAVTASVPTVTSSLPLATLALAAPAPQISTGVAVAIPATATELAALTPVVSGGASVAVPAADLAVAAPAPSLAVNALALQVPVVLVTLEGLVPAVATGVAVSVPAAALTVDALAPDVGGNLGERFDLTALLADDLLTLIP